MLKIVERAFLFGAVTTLFFLLFEGCSSTIIGLYDTAPRAHPVRQYDSLLGWTSIPSLSHPDFWGPGNDLHTNIQGFRNRTAITPQAEEGRVRILCSGDSFAFGQGVGDDHTWCHRLSVLDRRIESVNIGQSGYGVDQAYLRYERDGAEIEHSMHLFTFIASDLDRIGSGDHHGFPKPVLQLDGPELRVTNVPVPRALPAAKRWLRNFAKSLRSVEALRRLARLLSRDQASSGIDASQAVVKPPLFDEVRPVAIRIFEEANRLGEERGSSTVFVYLPTEGDLVRDKAWRGWTQGVMDSLGFHFVDLTPQLREVPLSVSEELFLHPDLSAGGHYSRAANAWVAEVLYGRIRHLVERASPTDSFVAP
jgi:hypothetical protein